jgi:hypothetical protein
MHELGEIRSFNPRNFTQDLRLREGVAYVEGSTIEHARRALSLGFAVYAEGCDGRAFVWGDNDGYKADVFFMGPARHKEFDSLDEAADFAASMCE